MDNVRFLFLVFLPCPFFLNQILFCFLHNVQLGIRHYVQEIKKHLKIENKTELKCIHIDSER